MKKTITFALLLSAINLLAQEKDTTYWRHAFKTSINFNQAAFSSNWIAGGTNSVGFNALINHKANYKKAKHSWDNEIDLLYGSINNQGQGMRKNNDRIYLDTKYGYSISPNWNMFGSLNVLTQFAAGYKYEDDAQGIEQSILISEFMAPGYFTASLGFEYTPKEYLKIRLSPFAPRLTVVRNKELYLNVPNNYGVDIGSTTRWEEFAFRFLINMDKDLNDNINLKFRYVLFGNYESLEFNQIDHRLDAIISANIAKYFDVKLSAILMYDYDQDVDIQLSQALGLGFVYTFKNFKDK